MRGQILEMAVLPLIIAQLILYSNFLLSSEINDILAAKSVILNSSRAEDVANSLIMGNCSSITHFLQTVPECRGYCVRRVAVVNGSVQVVSFGTLK